MTEQIDREKLLEKKAKAIKTRQATAERRPHYEKPFEKARNALRNLMRYHSDRKTTAGRPASVRTASEELAKCQNELNVLDEIISEIDREIVQFDEQLVLADLYEDHAKKINRTFKQAKRTSDRCTELERKIQEALQEYVSSSNQLMQVGQTINSAWGASFSNLPIIYSMRQFALDGVLQETENERQEKADRQQLAEELGQKIIDLTKITTTLTTQQSNKLVHTLGLMKSWKKIINNFQKPSEIVFARTGLIPTKLPEPEKETPIFFRPADDKTMEHRAKHRQPYPMPTFTEKRARNVRREFAH